MKLNKVAFAVASVLAIASGVAQAGQIDSSSATLAREVIWSDAQVVRAPSKAYTFGGDVDATVNEQRFQLQYTLSKGEWAVGSGNVISAPKTLIDISNAGLLMVNGKPLADFGVIAKAFVLEENKSQLIINVTVPVGTRLAAPSWLLNAGANTQSNNVGITKLFTVAGKVSCETEPSALDIEFAQATTHSDEAKVDSSSAPGAEHTRSGSTNKARLLNFVQNLSFSIDRTGTAASQINSAELRQLFVATTTPDNKGGKEHTLGTVKLERKANGLDLDYTKKYANTGAPVAPATFVATDFNVLPDGNKEGSVDLTKTKGLTIKVEGSMAQGSRLELRDGTTVIAQTAELNAAASSATFELDDPAVIVKVANGAKVVYVVNGKFEIPDQGDFTVTASLNKEVYLAGTSPNTDVDQPLSCTKPLTGLGNSGIKIDVRNYASYATFGDKGPATTLRIINNSESRTADLYAQMIYADGTYGAWGMVGSLAPRAALNISNKDLEAKMVNAPKAEKDNPFGTGTVYTSASGAAVLKNESGAGDRVRIMSNSGSTLRVQSYMVVGNTVLDTSNAQGVDFENGGSRVPLNGVDAQPVSQDAINGISK